MVPGYVDSHSAVFSPKSTDPANLGVNMCMNILDGDNSPRVKESLMKDVSQRFHNLNLNVSHNMFEIIHHIGNDCLFLDKQ